MELFCNTLHKRAYQLIATKIVFFSMDVPYFLKINLLLDILSCLHFFRVVKDPMMDILITKSLLISLGEIPVHMNTGSVALSRTHFSRWELQVGLLSSFPEQQLK